MMIGESTITLEVPNETSLRTIRLQLVQPLVGHFECRSQLGWIRADNLSTPFLL